MPQVIAKSGAYNIAVSTECSAGYLGVHQTVVTISDNIWINWQQVYQTSATTIWGQWVVEYAGQQGSQTAQIRAGATTNVVQLEARAKVEANARAAALLKSTLSALQREQYENERAFEVVTCRSGATRRYKLKHGWAGNVFLLDEAGREVERFCIHPSVGVPEADNLVAQKLLLESDETTFLRTANRSVLSDLGWVVASRAA